MKIIKLGWCRTCNKNYLLQETIALVMYYFCSRECENIYNSQKCEISRAQSWLN